MNKVFKKFLIFGTFSLMSISCYAAPSLTSMAAVNVTSDTATTAKNMAFKEARRQITTDVISKYSNSDAFKELMKNATDSDLTNLISSTNIDSEQLSATTYSANIKMTVDSAAAKKWLNDNNVQNWIGDPVSVDKQIVMINMSNGLADWIEINRAANADKIDIDVKKISDGQVIAEIPAGSRSMFSTALRGTGWSLSDDSGVLRVWK